MFRRKSIILLVVLLVALFAVSFAVAQEPTEEAPVVAVTPEVIEVEAGESTEVEIPGEGTEIIVTTEEPPVVTVEQEAPDYLTLIIAVVAALFAGVLLGAKNVSDAYKRALESKPLQDSTESLLAAAVPMAALEQVNGLVNRFMDFVERFGMPTLEVIENVTDLEPNEEAPASRSTGRTFG